MIEKLNKEDIIKAAKGLIFLALVSLLYSYFLISISIILLGVLGLIYRISSKDFKLQWFPIILMTLGSIPFLMGMLNSEESFLALKELQYNAAYASVPVVLLLLPSFTEKDKIEVFSFFILFMFLSTIPVLWSYLQNYDEVTLSLGSGRAIATPIDHVRYSIFIAIAFVFSAISFYLKKAFFGKNGRKIFLFFAGYLFVVVHVLAVRSGILLSYIGLLAGGTLVLYLSGKYKYIILLWALVLISPVAAYMMVPSFKNKISYVRYDYSLMKSGEGGNYSDSERMRSLKIGAEIWKENFWFGIGSGDFKSEIDKKYEEQYQDTGQARFPHNQLLKIAGSAGTIGLLFYVLSIYLPFLWNKNLLDPYVLALIVIVSASFLVEATLERTYFLVFYLLFAGLLYKKN